MDHDWAVERVVRFVAERPERIPESIQREETLASLDMDSLGDVEFIMEIEDECQVEIPDPVEPLVTVGDLVYVLRTARSGDESP